MLSERSDVCSSASAATSAGDGRGGPACEAFVLDGRDGRQLWAWGWPGSPDVLRPLVVDFDGPETPGRHVCILPQSGDEAHRVVVLASDGTARHREPLKLAFPGFAAFSGFWNRADVDGDGKDELLYASDGRLHAGRLTDRGLEPLWSWTLPTERAKSVAPVATRGTSTMGTLGGSPNPPARDTAGRSPASSTRTAGRARVDSRVGDGRHRCR